MMGAYIPISLGYNLQVDDDTIMHLKSRANVSYNLLMSGYELGFSTATTFT